MILNNFKVKNNLIKIWNFNRWINWIIFALQLKKKHYKLLFSLGIVHKWRHWFCIIFYHIPLNVRILMVKLQNCRWKVLDPHLLSPCHHLLTTPNAHNSLKLLWKSVPQIREKKFSEFYLRLSNGGIFTLFLHTHTHTHFFSSQKKFKEYLRQKKEQSVFFDQI